MWGKKPVILLGHGARGASIEKLLSLGVPILTSWQVKDLVDNHHDLYFGSPGIYGQRMANKVLYESDQVLALGNRLSIWNTGHDKLNKDVTMVDLDCFEAERYKHIQADVGAFVATLEPADVPEWVQACRGWKRLYPLVEACHADGEFINSYRFVDALHKYLRPDEVIVTDMGTALVTAHQVLKLKPPQRLMTSGGLGEMGCALPAAIGASFARGKGEVLCLHCDGGMMMNLQELQTIVHHKLPIKIIVFRNDSYLMIRHTQKLAGQPETGIAKDSGVSFPDYRKLAHAWGMMAADLRTWDEFDALMPQFFGAKEPALIQFWMQPDQRLVPKLDPIYVDGKPTSPRFCDMTPEP